MKQVLISSIATVLLASVLGVCGAEEPGKTKSAPQAAKPKARTGSTVPVKESGVLTGSLIKTTYRRNGVITDGPSPVLVLDSKAIADSGAANLRQLLVRTGTRR